MRYYNKGFAGCSDSKGAEVLVAFRREKKKLRRKWVASLIGAVGCVCLLLAEVGLWHKHGVEQARVEPTVDRPAREAANIVQGNVEEVVQNYYPLEVGRYWIYQRLDPLSGTTTEVERRIVRRESREGRDIYFFDDGTVAYREEERIFEMGPEGGVNVVLTDADHTTSSYAYRSQGLHIEKQVGSRDTVLETGSLRYEDCIQIVTRFRKEEGARVMSYASYYSPGIGLVGREVWPSNGEAPTEILLAFGTRKL